MNSLAVVVLPMPTSPSSAQSRGAPALVSVAHSRSRSIARSGGPAGAPEASSRDSRSVVSTASESTRWVLSPARLLRATLAAKSASMASLVRSSLVLDSGDSARWISSTRSAT